MEAIHSPESQAFPERHGVTTQNTGLFNIRNYMKKIVTHWYWSIEIYIGCSFCRLIRRPEQLFGRHWYLPAK
jgi:hypothetical protein